MNEVCKDCLNWQRYGKDCWYFWQGKKTCTQRVDENEENDK